MKGNQPLARSFWEGARTKWKNYKFQNKRKFLAEEDRQERNERKIKQLPPPRGERGRRLFKVFTHFGTTELVFGVSERKNRYFKRISTVSNPLKDFLHISSIFETKNEKTNKFLFSFRYSWDQIPQNHILAKVFLTNSDFWQTVNNSTSLHKKCRKFPYFLSTVKPHKKPFGIGVNAAEGRAKKTVFPTTYTKKMLSSQGKTNGRRLEKIAIFFRKTQIIVRLRPLWA